METTLLVGPIPAKLLLGGSDWNLKPLPQYEDICAHLANLVQHDGFIYPPLLEAAHRKPGGREFIAVGPPPYPAATFPSWVTHTLTLSESDDANALRFGRAGMILGACSFLTETALQFEGWRHAGRLYFRRKIRRVLTQEDMSAFVDTCLVCWRTLPPRDRLVLTNAFQLHVRASSYVWDWEQFFLRYAVADAVAGLALKRRYTSKRERAAGVRRRRSHNNQLAEACRRLGVSYDAAALSVITELRKAFFHEALWAASPPGMGRDAVRRDLGWSANQNLQHLVERLLVAFVGWDSAFTRSPWTRGGLSWSMRRS